MMDITIAMTIAGGGVSIQNTVRKAVSGVVSGKVTLPKGKAGTLSTRTSNTVGTATLGASHGITTGQVVDVYWAGGMRYGVTVGTVAGTSVPLTDTGAGDNYPVQGTAITVSPVVAINVDFDGDDCDVEMVQCTKSGHFVAEDAANAALSEVDLVAGEPWAWWSGTGSANPMTGNAVDEIRASTSDTSSDATLTYLFGVNNAV